jgi:hypothetical protein
MEIVGIFWNIFWPFDVFYDIWQCCGNLVYLFFAVLGYCVKKNLATLTQKYIPT